MSDHGGTGEHGTEPEVPHEHRARVSNVVAGELKKLLGEAVGDEDYAAEGTVQREVARDDVRPETG